MARISLRQLEAKHGQRLAALQEFLQRGQHALALEFMRQVLGDPTIPAEVRIMVRTKEIEALLGLGRTNEAYIAASQVESLIRRHRLFEMDHLVRESVERAKKARGA